MSKCRFVVFSDLHYKPEKQDPDSTKLTDYAVSLTKALVNKMNNDIEPNVAFFLGDLINDHDDKIADAKNIKFVMDMFSKSKAKIHICTGNHDMGPYDNREEIEKIMGVKNSTYSFDLDGYHFIILGLWINKKVSKENHSIPRTQNISTADLEWLKNDLDKTQLPTIVFSHYGLCDDCMDFSNEWFIYHPETATYSNAKEIKKVLLNSKKVMACFNGHQHWTKVSIEDGIPYYSVGSLTEDVNGDKVPDGVYCIVKLEDNNISVLDRHIRLK